MGEKTRYYAKMNAETLAETIANHGDGYLNVEDAESDVMCHWKEYPNARFSIKVK